MKAEHYEPAESLVNRFTLVWRCF